MLFCDIFCLGIVLLCVDIPEVREQGSPEGIRVKTEEER